MPLPWKKSRVTRISRLVADLQSSPRHGGSLVVETGFPTSLVDLFVKNRDRLQKPSKKKKKHRPEEEPPLEISDPVLLSPLPPHLMSSDPFDDEPPPFAAPPLEEKGVGGGGSGDVAPEAVMSEGTREIVDGVGGAVSGVNSVFVAIFKVFVIVVLALSTKRLVIGITISAFVLLLLEFVGKRVVCFFRPCSDARLSFEPLIRRVSVFLNFFPKKCLLAREGNENCHFPKPELSFSVREEIIRPSLNAPAEEIQVVEDKFETIVNAADNSILWPDTELVSSDRRLGCSDAAEMQTKVVDDAHDGGNSRLGGESQKQNRKHKSKFIKRIMPKKLRNTKKGKKKDCEPEMLGDSSNFLGDHSTTACQGEKAEQVGAEQREDAKAEQGSGVKQGEDIRKLTAEIDAWLDRADNRRKQSDNFAASQADLSTIVTAQTDSSTNTGASHESEIAIAQTDSSTIPRASHESESAVENARMERNGRFAFLVILPMVLAGLLGGRYLAFVLTVGCFAAKLIGTCR